MSGLPAPYYDEGGITIYHSDCREILPLLGTAAAAVLTDPPYAEQTHAGARTAARQKVNYHKKTPGALLTFDSFTEAELRDVFDMIGSTVRRWVVSFMDDTHAARFKEEPPAGLRYVRTGVWIKPNGAPQFTGDRPGQGWEAVAILHTEGGRMRWNGGGRHAVWTCNKPHQSTYPGDHPTVKPLSLVAEMVRLFSDPGDLVLDPFMGSGTTLVAAKQEGRRAIGIETREEHCESAVQRLRQEVLCFAAPVAAPRCCNHATGTTGLFAQPGEAGRAETAEGGQNP